MRRCAILCVFASTLFSVIANDVAYAQQSTDRQRAFRTLIATGFEIKSAAFGPLDSGHPIGETPMVTILQKGKEVAVCTVAYGNWSVMKDESLANPQLCDVRLFD